MKLKLFFMIFLLSVFVSGCGGSVPGTISSGSTSVAENQSSSEAEAQAPERGGSIQNDVQGILGGLSDGSDNYGLLSDVNAISFNELTVYIDAFPKDTAGGPINAATDTQKKRMIELHKKFMQYYAPNQQIEYSVLDEFGQSYNAGDENVWSKADASIFTTSLSGKISITTNKLKIVKETTAEDVKKWLTNEPVLKAACLYLDIDNPVIQTESEYNDYGEATGKAMKIYQQGISDIETLCNASLRVISLRGTFNDNELGVLLWVSSPEAGEIKGKYKRISCEEAIASVQSGKGFVDAVGGITENEKPVGKYLGVDIVYRTNYKLGYNIPCYRFAFSAQKDESNLKHSVIPYAYYYFPAVDFVVQ